MPNNKSLIDAAVVALQQEKKPADLFDLFEQVTKGHEMNDEVKADLITKFYTDLTTSAKFVYVGDNKWNLKANEKIELWEKDGSFYKEYNVIELPDEYKEPERVIPKKATPKVEKPVVEEEPVVVVEEEPVVVEVKKPVQEPIVEPVVTPAFEADLDDSEEEYDEEVFEDYDDFDEDKYNEYMDTYEDQYDD